MTREEQIMEYANSFKGKGVESDELKEIIRLAIIDGAKWADAHPKEYSLPSDLDEAAEKQGNMVDNYGDPYGAMVDAFKAGAEWMAGQVETIDGEITTTSDNGWEIIRIPKKLYPLGTKVTVQIRKKQ